MASLRSVKVVQLEGELDAFVAPALRQRLGEAVDTGASVVVVDMSRVSFLDSTILGALVGALRRMRERDGELKLVYPPHPASRIFELTALDGVFAAADEVDLESLPEP